MFKLGNLSYEEKATGVLFGFLNSIFQLAKRFDTKDFVFCWDSKTSFRKNIYPQYKENRIKNLTEDEKFERTICYEQFEELKKEILPKIGFVNTFYQKGIEADDIMAKLVFDYPEEDWIIVSSDNDLWQLLHHIVAIYQPDKKKFYTATDFEKEWGIQPSRWADVKAIAGDNTDGVIGVKSIGLKTAVRIIRGEPISARIKSLLENNTDTISLNKKLVTLPFPKTESEILLKSKFDFKEFDKVCYNNNFSYFQKKENYLQLRKIFGE